MELKINKTITYAILSIWGIIVVFGVLTLIGPAWLEELADPGKNVEAISLKNAGDTFLKSKSYPLAIAQYTAALEIVPDLKSAIANLAISYQKTGDYNRAIMSFKHLLTLNPEYPGVIYYNLGEIYEKTNQTQKALKSYLAAAENSVSPEKSYQKAGRLYMEQKDWTSAIHNFKLAIDNRQDIKNAYKSMLIKNQKVHSDTSKTYSQITEILKSESYIDQLSNYDEVLFNKQLSKDINLAKTYNNTGYCLALLEKYEEAEHYLKIAIKIDPGYKEAVNNLKVVESFLNE